MKSVAIGSWLLICWAVNVLGAANVASDPALVLLQFGAITLTACGLFGLATWRWDAERRWRRCAG